MRRASPEVVSGFLREYFGHGDLPHDVRVWVDGETVKLMQGLGRGARYATWELSDAQINCDIGDYFDRLVNEIAAKVAEWNPRPWWAARSPKPTHAGKWRKFGRAA